jgi:oxygen-independent coproporphyrinogen-3 oxidase
VRLRDNQAGDARQFLSPLIDDGLVEVQDQKLTLTERGRPFLRNACMFFDYRLRRQQPQAKTFSQAL